MKHIGLFEGIGGFSLAARWAGWETVAWCEWNEFGQTVLKHHFPVAEGFGDITKTDFTKYANTIDIVTGGFPCQPYSVAGKRKGKDDERHLWPEMLRAIREIKPRWVVGENVLGLVNWNGGLVFDEVQADLEAQGYEVQPYILPACAKNAPHRRDRVWFVAYKNTNGNGRGSEFGKEKSNIGQFGNIGTGDNERVSTNDGETWAATYPNCRRNDTAKRAKGSVWEYADKEQQRNRGTMQINGLSNERTFADTNSLRFTNGRKQSISITEREFSGSNIKGNVTNTSSGGIQGHGGESEEQQLPTTELNTDNSKHIGGVEWRLFPTQPPICGRNDGISERLDTITFSKWRKESIKAYGNAIVPQVAFEIYKAIIQYENKF
jgi:DNA (cytosine-5)-methyltransferase 1